MGRVPSQKHPPRAQRVGNIGAGVPVHHVFHRHGNGIGAQCRVHELHGAFGGQSRGDVGQRMVGIAGGVDHEKCAFKRLLEAEEAAQLAVVDVDDGPLLVVQERAQVGAEIDRHAV